jgi:hypothetical protein
MLTREEISATLNLDVHWARARVAEALRDIDATIADMPGVLPDPDFLHRPTSAISELTYARAALKRALDRSTAFTFHGIVPEDLK